ncbi:SDR family NAD(P)-dependent oxidoreductase [Amycolatopsis jejuensis]|uniref:SDR family NAD(P)-dependent oxidoreductase n=1 Tax=Amycolatopsis jejuensis TaxID=330084 RepID=UPI000ADA5150|nr:SDR family oxidoreductase [Amycolatopsis jejuensis]
MARLSGKTVVLTGGARGQGWREAGLLAAEGARVVVTDVVEPSERLPDGAEFHRLDVASAEGWVGLADGLRRRFGVVHGLVNNAGIVGARGKQGRLRDVRLEDWNRLLEINTTGPMLGIQALAPLMTDGGSIVNISSVVAAGAHMSAGYGVSKWALRGLSRIASAELGPAGIRVNTVLPGYIETPMQGDSPQRFVDAWLSLIPLGRTGTPDDVAPLVAFLLSDDAAWISGAEIAVDGGSLGHAGLKIVADAMGTGHA